jgi:hypothetical protein
VPAAFTHTQPGADAPAGRESDDERHNRQLVELVNELRVALPGVQMLFGFLLAVPFSQRFVHVTSGQRGVYYASFVAAALASAFLIAPASFHRIVWRQGHKRRLLHVSNALAIAGTAFLAGAISGSVALVTSVLFSTWTAAVAAGAIAGILALLWYVIPLAFRLRALGADTWEPGGRGRLS